MSGPVQVRTDVRYSGNGRDAMRLLIILQHFRYGGAFALFVSIRLKDLFEQCTQIYQMACMSEVLLRDLKFQRERRVGHTAEQRMERFAWLEVYGTVLGLYEDIVGKLAIQRLKLVVSGYHTVYMTFVLIDKCPPEYNSSIRLQCFGKHICTVGMRTAVILGTGLTFGVCLHQESAEVGNQRVDLFHFIFPPLPHLGIFGVRRVQSAYLLGGAEFCCQIHFDAVRTECVCQSGGFD